MATKSRYIDMAGLTPIVDGIRVNATSPGQLGSEMTGTEIAYLDGLTPGTATASKAVVLGSSKEISTITTATITNLTSTTITPTTIAGAVNFSGAPTFASTLVATGAISGPRLVVADAAFASPVALTAAQSGALCVFDETAGAIFTLPAAAAGLWYDFVIAVASSSNSHRVACTSGDFLLGSIMSHATDDTGLSSAYAANGSTHLAIQLDSDAVGRLAGGKFRVTAISGTQWVIEGDLLATGTVATPFETA